MMGLLNKKQKEIEPEVVFQEFKGERILFNPKTNDIFITFEGYKDFVSDLYARNLKISDLRPFLDTFLIKPCKDTTREIKSFKIANIFEIPLKEGSLSDPLSPEEYLSAFLIWAELPTSLEELIISQFNYQKKQGLLFRDKLNKMKNRIISSYNPLK